MKVVQLTPHIRYVPLSDDEGEFGLLMNHLNDTVLNVVEVHDKDEFTDAFNSMVSLTEVAA